METIHLVEFDGKTIETTVTSRSSTAQRWLQNIVKLLNQHRTKRIVGMDCKYIRHPINSMSNKTATLNLCVGTKCLVIQLLHINRIPQSITDFLSDPRNMFVGIEILENSRKLHKEYALDVDRKVDLHFLAKHWFPVRYNGRPSLRALASRIIGLNARRKCGDNNEGNWESVVLNEELVEQACADAYALYNIACKLLT
ncbi:polynucleotidyl transferase [Striga asiatica]|uniref:Polynucleotidyl transferase n=1 Tax=Striga asiatica TaxID=4170 RepID=A0A5A7PQ00_STRAF|nr:polynucleotidyl transferase [Striga asiatica]